MTEKLSIQLKLIQNAVNKLRNFGFANVNEENITTDEVYSFYFLKMLNEMSGENKETDSVINQLSELINRHVTPNLNQ